jgi:hypothetical protein
MPAIFPFKPMQNPRPVPGEKAVMAAFSQGHMEANATFPFNTQQSSLI